MAMMGRTGFWRFLLSFGADWLSAMSGGLSVPLTIAAVFIDGTRYKVGLAALAVIAFIGSSYRVWRNERLRAVDAEAKLAGGAEVQAQLARAELDAHQRASDEEEAHRRWTDGVLAKLRHPAGPYPVHVAPGEQLHAEWALKRGLLGRLDVSGMAVILPPAERWSGPFFTEAERRAVRQRIMAACAEKPEAPSVWEYTTLGDESRTYVAVAGELHRDGLVTATISAEAVTIRLTPYGNDMVRLGTF